MRASRAKSWMCLVAGMLAVVVVAWPGMAMAQTAPADNPGPSLLPKTLLFVSVAAAADFAVGYIVTGGLATGTAIAVVNSASGWLLYHVHESVWAAAAPNEAPTEQLTAEKTATFTAANSVRLLGIGVLFTQNVVLTIEFLVLNALGDAGSYIVTDRLWNYFGPQPTPR